MLFVGCGNPHRLRITWWRTYWFKGWQPLLLWLSFLGNNLLFFNGLILCEMHGQLIASVANWVIFDGYARNTAAFRILLFNCHRRFIVAIVSWNLEVAHPIKVIRCITYTNTSRPRRLLTYVSWSLWHLFLIL